LKTIFLAIIVLISYWGFSENIPPSILLSLYGVLVIVPVALIMVRKNMLYALMAWFFFLFFKNGLWNYQSGKLILPFLPDLQAERAIWILLFSVLFFGITTRKMKLDIGITKLEVAMLCFCFYIFISMLVSGSYYQAGHGLTMSFLLFGYFIPYSSFFLAKYIVNDEQKIKKIFIFFAIIGFYLGIIGIFEYFRLESLVIPPYIMNSKLGIHWGRARGPFLEAVGNGWTLGMCLFITLHLLLHSNKKWIKFFYCISIVSMLIAILFTFTRNVWLGFAVSSLVIPIFLRQARKTFLVSGLAMLIIVSSLFSLGQFKQHDINDSNFGDSSKDLPLTEKIATRGMKSETVEGRFELYKIGWKKFTERPVFGFGFNTFVTARMHDALVGIVVELGLLGLSFYFFIIINILIISIKLYHLLPSNAFIGKGIVVIFLGIFILYSIVIEFSPFSSLIFPLSYFYLIAGIIAGLYQRVSKQQVSEKLNWGLQGSEVSMQVEKYG